METYVAITPTRIAASAVVTLAALGAAAVSAPADPVAYVIVVSMGATELLAGAAFFWHWHRSRAWEAVVAGTSLRQIGAHQRTLDRIREQDTAPKQKFCNVCGLPTYRDNLDTHGESYGAIHCRGSFGYGSTTKDGTEVEFTLCEPCYDGLVFTVHPRVWNYFSGYYVDKDGNFLDDDGNVITDP